MTAQLSCSVPSAPPCVCACARAFVYYRRSRYSHAGYARSARWCPVSVAAALLLANGVRVRDTKGVATTSTDIRTSGRGFRTGLEVSDATRSCAPAHSCVRACVYVRFVCMCVCARECILESSYEHVYVWKEAARISGFVRVRKRKNERRMGGGEGLLSC